MKKTILFLLLFSASAFGQILQPFFQHPSDAVLTPVSVVQSASLNGSSVQPITKTLTVTAGHAVLIAYQLYPVSTSLTFSTSKSDTCTLIQNYSFVYGFAICTNLTGGSTAFNITWTAAPSTWSMVWWVELANYHGVGCTPGYLNTGALTATSGASPYYGSATSCTTTHANEMLLSQATTQVSPGEMALASGLLGCCYMGTSLSPPDPGVGLIYQVYATPGTYHAVFASTYSGDNIDTDTISVW